MPLDPEKIEVIPTKVTFSGEGLNMMSVAEFKAIAKNLGKLGLEIESVEYPWGVTEDVEALSEPEIKIHKSHFTETAEKHGILPSTASKAWESIWRRKDRYDMVRQKQQLGLELQWSEEVVLRQFPEWRLELYADTDTLHYSKLYRAYHVGLLEELFYMGPKLLTVVGLVLQDIEIEKRIEQQS